MLLFCLHARKLSSPFFKNYIYKGDLFIYLFILHFIHRFVRYFIRYLIRCFIR